MSISTKSLCQRAITFLTINIYRIMKRTDVQNKADYTAEKKKLQGLLEQESEIEKKLLSGNHNEDTWRELNQVRYKITVSQAKLDGSFYKGEPSPRGVRTTNVHQYNK